MQRTADPLKRLEDITTELGVKIKPSSLEVNNDSPTRPKEPAEKLEKIKVLQDKLAGKEAVYKTLKTAVEKGKLELIRVNEQLAPLQGRAEQLRLSNEWVKMREEFLKSLRKLKRVLIKELSELGQKKFSL